MQEPARDVPPPLPSSPHAEAERRVPAAPPTVPGPLPRPSSMMPGNIIGLIGLIFTAIATLLSPTGFLGITLCFLVPLGFLGLGLSLAGCFFKPRWYGVVGLVVGLLCVLFWSGLFIGMSWYGNAQAAKRGLTASQWSATSMDCISMVWQVEVLRSPTGAPPAVTAAGIPADPDPWGRPYHYTLTPVSPANPYGYTFISDGPDGVAGTADDVDLIKIHPTDGTFALPAPPPLVPASPTGVPTTPAPVSPVPTGG